VKAYVFLAIGMIWLIVAILTGFGVYWHGAMTTLTAGLIRVLLPMILFGWIAPVGFGLWLLFRK
jgi:hypothetical protein